MYAIRSYYGLYQAVQPNIVELGRNILIGFAMHFGDTPHVLIWSSYNFV